MGSVETSPDHNKIYDTNNPSPISAIYWFKTEKKNQGEMFHCNINPASASCPTDFFISVHLEISSIQAAYNLVWL